MLDRAAVLIGFEQVGGSDRALEMGRDYALDRIAFGRPDRFVPGREAHAGRHVRLGDAGALQLLLRRLGALDQRVGTAGSRGSCARISATQAFQHCSKNNIQVHGGMGFTWEFDCHLYYRRSNALALALGSLSYWEDLLIERMRQQRTRRKGSIAMNFDDTPQEAAFRAEVRTPGSRPMRPSNSKTS